MLSTAYMEAAVGEMGRLLGRDAEKPFLSVGQMSKVRTGNTARWLSRFKDNMMGTNSV